MDRKSTEKGFGPVHRARLFSDQRRNGQFFLCGWKEGGPDGWGHRRLCRV